MTDPKLDDDLIEQFRSIPTGIVTDSLRRLGAGEWMLDVLPLKDSWKFVGRARTMKYAPRSGEKRGKQSNYTVIRSSEPGDVLVIAACETTSFVLGENVGHFAVQAGLAGIVTDGRVRDALDLRELDFAVFSRGISARAETKYELVETDVPVRCGGAQVNPGDLVCGDADGIVVVPAAAARAVIVEMQDLVAIEEEQEKAIQRDAPLEEVQQILAKKKKRKGPELEAQIPSAS